MKGLKILSPIGVLMMVLAGILPMINKEKFFFNSSMFPTLMILGSICMVAGMILPMLFGSIGKSKAMKNGLSAIGTIKNIRQTGTYVNNQPQVNLELLITKEDGEEYKANLVQVFSYPEIAALQVGANLPVRYLQESPSVVAIDRNINKKDYQEVYDKIMVKKGIVSQENLDIAKNGVTGNAVVNSLNPTGRIENGNPELEIKMTITKENGEKIEVSVTKVILKNVVSYVQAGQLIEVIYMPSNPEKLVVNLPAQL